MGNFAENLNLGNRFRPPLTLWPLAQASSMSSYVIPNNGFHTRILLVLKHHLHRPTIFRGKCIDYTFKICRHSIPTNLSGHQLHKHNYIKTNTFRSAQSFSQYAALFDQLRNKISDWTSSRFITTHNWHKWKNRFFTSLCYKIYRVEAVDLSLSKYTFKVMIFLNMWNLGQFREN